MREKNLYEPPKADVSRSSAELFEIKRGFWLTTILVLLFIFNAITAASLIFLMLAPDAFSASAQTITPLSRYLFAFAALTNIVMVIMVWFWKKIGVYGIAAVSLFYSVADIVNGHPVLSSMVILLGPLIVILLVRNKWDRFV